MKQDVNSKTRKHLLILASGEGTNFEAIARHLQKTCPESVSVELICDKKGANALSRAKKLGIKSHFVEFENLYNYLKNYPKTVDLFALAGFMRILPEKILKLGTFINIHPSLLPEFKGKNAITQAFEAGAEKTGVTVHFVNRKVDSGKIIAQKALSAKGLSLEKLEDEIHKIEHEIYPKIVENLLFKKNVLVFGGGAREHALSAAIKKSPFLNELYLASPNDGFKNLGKTIDFKDFEDLAEKAAALKIDLLVVGPENPLCEGISDIFKAKKIKTIGANKAWARLEGSKTFAKKFMQKHNIQTARYIKVSAVSEIKKTLENFKTPPVIKADGLALGKGVLVPKTFPEAAKAAKEFLKGKFGEASREILVEERLFGKEVSVISLWDGKTLMSFPPACDYKRLLDGNKGKNTGGMGSYAPSRISKTQKIQLENYLKTLENALLKEKADFTGVIYSGLILTRKGPFVLEYNMRFGDPETQALLEILESDLLDLFLNTAEGTLSNRTVKFAKKRAYCTVLASEGYPENPEKGAPIEIPENINSKIYFAGVKNTKTHLQTNGGRVLSLVNSGANALQKIAADAKKIRYEGKIYRKDIGK